MTQKSEYDKDQSGRMLLSHMPPLYRRHLILYILRHLGRSEYDNSRMMGPIRTEVFSTPIGRKVEDFIKNYDNLGGSGFESRVSVIECILSIGLRKGLIEEDSRLVPSVFRLTDEGKAKLEKRDQFNTALIGGIIKDRQIFDKRPREID